MGRNALIKTFDSRIYAKFKQNSIRRVSIEFDLIRMKQCVLLKQNIPKGKKIHETETSIRLYHFIRI